MGGPLSFLINFFKEGGPFMYAILLVAVFGLSIIAERFIVLVLLWNLDGKTFWEKIKRYLTEGKVNEAKILCEAIKAPVAKIFLRAIINFHESDKNIQNAVDESALEVIPVVEKRTHYLAMLANVSTLFGLLGTITGLIKAFAAVGAADPSQKAALLAYGISMAMNNTAFGLFMAITFMLAHSYLFTRQTSIIDEIDELSIKMMNLITHLKRG
ncbi:MAG: MotA/TolQ/ExbB proton channel family protein [Deltaproteobacteria bacterium]|nr:MotA/TolQ/ExbB proton channel family protein [Deltaproteobacteria bacterium]MCL5793191.1 MotA/TolQ/ExbB proton channel family protein [Deltaproteobacteria bacterium]